jgi:hypothetical protein
MRNDSRSGNIASGNQHPLPLLAQGRPIDWVGAAAGSHSTAPNNAPRSLCLPFDAATASRDERCCDLRRLGTKGLVLKDGKFCARSTAVSTKPMRTVSGRLVHEPGGQLLLAHCPRNYARIQVEDARTGNRLPYRMNVSHAISSTHVSRPAREESDY